MRRMILALVLLPLLSLAAPDDRVAARQYSQALIEQAYANYPEIPQGYLESQAWTATRWQHRIPDAASSHHDMPPVFGLFGLYGTDQYGFVDLVGRVADSAGVTREQLLASEAVYVDAVAAFVAQRITEYGLKGRPFEELRPIVELLSGIEVTSEATRYAVTSHAYEVYRTAGTGVDLGTFKVSPQPVDLRQVFTTDELQQLQAQTLVFDGDGAAISGADGKKKSASFSAGSAGTLEQIDVDYPGATWEEAYSYSSRGGSAITHVVVHTMQGSYAGSIAWFLNPTSQVSAHYLMRSSDGQITQMVRNADKAWHARNSNPYTIGIEHEGFVDNPDWYTDTMYEESAKLVAYTCNMYLIDCSMAYDGPSHSTVVELSEGYTVMGHQHYPDQTHTDPGINWDWPRYYALLNGGVVPPEVNRLPQASFVWSCNLVNCSFDATASSDADGAVVGYDWDFGGGQTGTGVTASNVFPVGGDYTVELAVTDDKGAVHTTRRSVRAVSPPSPPSQSSGGGGGAIGPWLLLAFVLLAGCARNDNVRLHMPPLMDADYYWIASRIFQNETNGKLEYLAHWNSGEDFPSMGIGHFIWFPEGVDAPFDESFPMMLEYQKAHADECHSIPDWLEGDAVPDAPWSSKQDFDAQLDSDRTASLREWLAGSAPLQAQYIVSSFNARWNALQLEGQDKAALTALLQRLLSDSRGLFAVIDYYNFKGLGSNPRERYAGEGWGLVQVLSDIVDDAAADAPGLVEQFSRAAENRLQLRVSNSPPERNEARWMPGWAKRVSEYRSKAPPLSHGDENAFRVTPYVQSQSQDSATITWFAKSADAGVVRVHAGEAMRSELQSESQRACALAYNLAEYADLEHAQSLPFQHKVRLDGLSPAQTIDVTVVQNGQEASLQIRMPAPDRAHFVVYGDSETEPESRGANARWTPQGDAGSERRYVVDQDEGYRQNLAVIAEKSPDFVAIAGDLVESGGEQRDWDEFWRHNATLAGLTRIVPAPGNHDYFGGPRDLGGYRAAQRAIAKYQAYFGQPSYYLHEQGPVALLVIDINNGLPERSAMDTNWYLEGTAPRWQADSEQHAWLQAQLAEAQANKAFTFVMFHHAPYSSGIHGRLPGVGDAENFSSGLPLRELTPLFIRYGVDAVFNGHDELYEHSAVAGSEILPDGGEAAHTVHYFTVGIGGDGLRGPDPLAENPYRVFLADEDAPEVWNADGVLQSGGKHYGHMDVKVERGDNGNWQARFEPVYIFPLMNAAGEASSFEARSYDDVLVLEQQHVD